MTLSTPAAASRIFISYRREETAYPAGWLFDRLVEHFGQGQVFKDVDSVQLGDDFVEVITAAVGKCDVLLALIGSQWLTITGESGRRLDDPDDFVRLEIEAALTRNVRVIPILVGGAQMPRAAQLPPSLAKLVRRHALELSPSRFDFDIGKLLSVLDRSLAERQVPGDAERQAPGDAERQAPGDAERLAPGDAERQAQEAQEARLIAERDDQAAAGACERAGDIRSAYGDRAAASTEPAVHPSGALAAYPGKPRGTISFGQGVYTVAWHPTGERVAVGGGNPWLAASRTWICEIPTGRQLLEVRHNNTVDAVAFSPDGKLLATGSADRSARVWDAATGRQLLEVRSDNWVYAVAFSPDGKLLATGSADKTARIWDTAYGRQLLEVRHDSTVYAVAFSPDGKLLATGSKDKTARIWDTAYGRQLLEVRHRNWVYAAAFSPDGKLLATGSKDKTARIWDAATGRQLLEVRHDKEVRSVTFGPDGKLLATGSADETVRIWDAGIDLANLNPAARHRGGVAATTRRNVGQAGLAGQYEAGPAEQRDDQAAVGRDEPPPVRLTRIRAPAVDVPALAEALCRWYESQDLEVLMAATPTGLMVQCRTRDGWKRAVGMGAALTVILRHENADLLIQIGPAQWSGKRTAAGAGAGLVAAAASVPVAAVVWVTVGIGTWRRYQLPKQTISFLRKAAPTYVRSAHGSQPPPPEPRDVGESDDRRPGQ